MRILAVIPARGGSKRLPGKNIRNFLGKPLIHWSIEFAKSIKYFDKVVISTDADEIANCCKKADIEVPYLRSPHLATDTASSLAVVLDVLACEEALGFKFDAVALIQPTTPIRNPTRWDEAYHWINKNNCDAVIGVSAVHDHPFHTFKWQPDGSLNPWFEIDQTIYRSQDLPPTVSVNGALYLIKTSVLKNEETFFPKQTKGILCSEALESIDIDTEVDWVIAETLVQYFKKSKK